VTAQLYDALAKRKRYSCVALKARLAAECVIRGGSVKRSNMVGAHWKRNGGLAQGEVRLSEEDKVGDEMMLYPLSTPTHADLSSRMCEGGGHIAAGSILSRRLN
jgi:hypothetical protein